MLRHLPGALLLAITAASFPIRAAAADWSVTGAQITFSLADSHLRDHGLVIVDSRAAVAAGDREEVGLGGPLHSFVASRDIDLRVHTSNGRVTGFDGAPIPFRGGLLLRAENPTSGTPVAPLALLDFTLDIDPAARRDIALLRTADPAVPVPLEVKNSGFALDAAGRLLRLRVGDLVLSEGMARALGQPLLAGQWLGAVDIRLTIEPIGPGPHEVAAPDPALPSGSAGMTTIDIKLGELYGMTSAGRVGTFPNGVNGLTAATTSCNNGNVDVPWNQPMAETHPFIGLAIYRDHNGAIEQLGRNWVKHGWFTLSNDQCSLGCAGGGGQLLAVGCSDTYDAANNAERFFLGPREEVNPHTGTWTACNSYFDATPADCIRSYFGGGHDAVEHRVEVKDADLGIVGATYLYEGAYFVAGDDTVSNNVGWRECTMVWTGSTWSFDTVPLGVLTPNVGPAVSAWGDMQSNGNVAADDGIAWLAVKSTSLGGGQWHYEYALYNRTSARGIHSFSVPVGSASITNVGFRDIDGLPLTDWTSSIANGLITWSTDDFVTDPSAPALTYQTLFNFRFDADAPPVAALGRGLLFKPGLGTQFALDTMGPAASTATPEVSSVPGGLFLSAGEPNPFSASTRIRFARGERGHARLSVLDVTGRVVRVLMDTEIPAGRSSALWDGRDASATPVASGVYFFRLEAGHDIRTTKTTLLR